MRLPISDITYCNDFLLKVLNFLRELLHIYKNCTSKMSVLHRILLLFSTYDNIYYFPKMYERPMLLVRTLEPENFDLSVTTLNHLYNPLWHLPYTYEFVQIDTLWKSIIIKGIVKRFKDFQTEGMETKGVVTLKKRRKLCWT